MCGDCVTRVEKIVERERACKNTRRGSKENTHENIQPKDNKWIVLYCTFGSGLTLGKTRFVLFWNVVGV